MNTVQFVYLVSSVLAGVVLAALLRRKPTVPGARTLLVLSVGLLIVALLCVGVVSRTIPRHIIQAIPAGIVLILVARHSLLAPAAAAPVCTFWLGVMINIWLFVLGIARILSGTFSTVEIVLTMVIAITSALGIVSIIRMGIGLGFASRILMATAFALGQFAAMVASFQFA